MSGFKLAFAILALVGVSLGSSDLTFDIDRRCDGMNAYDTKYPHETDCTKYYMCDHYKPVLFECPDKLEWNNDAKICDWPEKAGCSSSVYVKPCKPIPKPKCPVHDVNKPAVHLPNPKDCRSFYECDWGKLNLIKCPSGLHFNAAVKVCDYPEKAKCACRQSPIPY